MNVQQGIDKIGDLFLRTLRFVMVVGLATWLIGGNLYNYFATEQIQENEKELLQELSLIEPLNQYKSSDAILFKGRALITQRYEKTFYLPVDVHLRSIIDQVKQHFLQRGWEVEKHYFDLDGNPHLEVQNVRYMVSII